MYSLNVESRFSMWVNLKRRNPEKMAQYSMQFNSYRSSWAQSEQLLGGRKCLHAFSEQNSRLWSQ